MVGDLRIEVIAQEPEPVQSLLRSRCPETRVIRYMAIKIGYSLPTFYPASLLQERNRANFSQAQWGRYARGSEAEPHERSLLLPNPSLLASQPSLA